MVVSALLVDFPLMAADPAPDPVEVRTPVKLKSVQQAQTLPATVDAVEIRFHELVEKDEKSITAIFEALARHGAIRRLIFQMPNSRSW